jgi:hypothetical protein
MPFLKYGINLLYLINCIFWFLLSKKSKIGSVNSYATKYFAFFFLIFLIWNFGMIITNRSNLYHIICWIIVNLFELFFILDILFRVTKTRKDYKDGFVLIFAVLAIPIIIAAILTWSNRTYKPINTTDFYNLILLMIGSITILRFLLIQQDFLNHIESFFIFSGFILYFSLHILAGNVVSINFFRNFSFMRYANLISQIFWLGSLFFIWKIRSKHSS